MLTIYVRIYFRYPLLIGVVPCILLFTFAGWGVGTIITNQLYLGPLQFTQEEIIIPQLVTMLVGIPANILGAIIIPRIGQFASNLSLLA